MKKSILFTVVILSFVAIKGQSQTKKGTWLLGGSASYVTSDGNSALQINPNLGYFVANNFALGLNVGYTRLEDFSIYQFGPGLRLYFGNSNSGKLFLHGGANILTNSDFSDPLYGYIGRLGYAVFLNRSIALEIGLGYEKFEDSDAVFGSNFGFQIHFGPDKESEE